MSPGSKLKKIRLLETELFHSDGQTDMTKLTFVFAKRLKIGVIGILNLAHSPGLKNQVVSINIPILFSGKREDLLH
jgi:hypothetical protein